MSLYAVALKFPLTGIKDHTPQPETTIPPPPNLLERFAEKSVETQRQPCSTSQ